MIEFQFSLSTAEEESNYFTGSPETRYEPAPQSCMPEGVYRVIDGRMFRVAPGPSPFVAALRVASEPSTER